MNDILPCPFCGGRAKLFFNGTDNYWFGSCLPCDAEGPPSENQAEAIAAWNGRTLAPIPDHVRAMLKSGDAVKCERHGVGEWEWSINGVSVQATAGAQHE